MIEQLEKAKKLIGQVQNEMNATARQKKGMHAQGYLESIIDFYEKANREATGRSQGLSVDPALIDDQDDE